MTEHKSRIYEKCGGNNTVIMTNMTVTFPSRWEGALTKKRMRSREFSVWGVNWGGMQVICKDCQWTENYRFDPYVANQKLEAENMELKNKIADLERKITELVDKKIKGRRDTWNT